MGRVVEHGQAQADIIACGQASTFNTNAQARQYGVVSAKSVTLSWLLEDGI